jgi:glutaconate CoA-transferase subunit A
MQDAIAEYVQDGITLAIEGFTACICFAAAHEIIRREIRDLTLCRMTPDVIYDQMVAAGCVRKLVFSYLGNPGIGSLHCIRRAVEKGVPNPLSLEEYSHFGMIARYLAGASRLPFYPLQSYWGTDLPKANPKIQSVVDPYHGRRVAVVPPLRPDLTIVHAQRADDQGNTQLWGLLGVQKEAALAAEKVVVVVEEIVTEDQIRADPNRTLLPAEVVHAVVCEPKGAHPSYVQGYWDRDNGFYREWDQISRSPDQVQRWVEEWVYGVPNRAAYVNKIPDDIWSRLRPGSRSAPAVEFGDYR